jgi:hypothetical protein
MYTTTYQTVRIETPNLSTSPIATESSNLVTTQSCEPANSKIPNLTTDETSHRNETTNAPRTSILVNTVSSTTAIKTKSTQQRDQWARNNLPTRVQVHLDNPFGKDTKKQSFTTDVRFRHVLVFIVKSGYTTVEDRNILGFAYPLARRLFKIIRNTKNTDFRPLKNGIPPCITNEALIKEQQAMVTACFVHFNFDTASVIRYIGGQHTAAHRNVRKIIAELRRARIEEQLVNDLERIFTYGVTGICNAHSSEENFRAYLKYGNHKTVYDNIAQNTSTIMKEIRKGFALMADAELVWFLTNLHLTPTGLVGLNHLYNSPRFIFDSSF